MAATAMSTVSMSIVGAYMSMLDAKFVVAALVLNMFSTFIVLSLINPYKVGEEQDLQLVICMKAKASLKCWENIFWLVSK